jgi:hypothetical protein
VYRNYLLDNSGAKAMTQFAPMIQFSGRLLILAIVVLCLPSCTTMQTTYFRTGYTEIVQADHPGLQPFEGTPAFTQVDDMTEKSRALYGEGYVMLGYSQFVSPLLTSLAESYSTKYAVEKNAAQVVLETPKAGSSNLHYFLVTYWARVKPEFFSFGTYLTDLPKELLERIGKNLNMVIIEQVVPGTPAAVAGLRGGDVILAVNEEHMPDTKVLLQTIAQNAGQEIDVDISRDGTSLQMPVRLAKHRPIAVPEGKGYIGYYDSPWLNTKPKDWSGFSVAAIASATMASMQRMQQQQQLEYERARAQAQRNLDYLNSQSTAMPSSSGGRRGGNRGIPTSRRGGGRSQQTANGFVIPYADQQRAMEQLKEFGKSWGAQMDRQRRQNVQIFLNNAPNAYGSMGSWRIPVR